MRIRLSVKPDILTPALDIQKKKTLAAVVLFTIFCVTAYFFYALSIKNNIHSIMNLRQELQLKKQLLRIKEENYENMEENEAFLQMYRSGLNVPRTILSDALVTEALIHSSRLMAECGLMELEMLIGEKEILEAETREASETLYRVPFTVTGVGSYENAVSYIENLAEDRFFYAMEGIRLSSKNVTTKGDTVLELQLCVYGFIEQAEGTESVEEERPAREWNPFYYE